MSHEIQYDFEEECGALHAGLDDKDGRKGEALIHKCCADLGVNFAMGMQIVAWADEHIEVRGQKLESGNPKIDKLLANIIRIFEYFRKHPDQKHVFAVLYQFDIPLLDDIIGHRTPADEAKSMGVTREAVNKVVKEVREEFDLPIRKGQREEEACGRMSRRRLGQLVQRE